MPKTLIAHITGLSSDEQPTYQHVASQRLAVLTTN